MHESFGSFISSSILTVIFWFWFIVVILVALKWKPIRFWNCISPMTVDVEHLCVFIDVLKYVFVGVCVQSHTMAHVCRLEGEHKVLVLSSTLFEMVSLVVYASANARLVGPWALGFSAFHYWKCIDITDVCTSSFMLMLGIQVPISRLAEQLPLSQWAISPALFLGICIPSLEKWVLKFLGHDFFPHLVFFFFFCMYVHMWCVCMHICLYVVGHMCRCMCTFVPKHVMADAKCLPQSLSI